MHKLAILILFVLPAQYQILMSDTEPALQIEPRFVGNDHPFFQRYTLCPRRQPPVKSLWPLMHTKNIAYSMPGTVVVIHPCFPQRASRQHIQILSADTLRKFHRRQIQMSPKHCRKAPLLIHRQGSQRNCTGNIRSSLTVMPAGVRQAESFPLHLHICLLRCRIMYNGAMRSISNDR